jgi:hypothetical protein
MTKFLPMLMFITTAALPADAAKRDEKAQAMERLEAILGRAKTIIANYDSTEGSKLSLDLEKKFKAAEGSDHAIDAIDAMLMKKVCCLKEKLENMEALPKQLVYETCWYLLKYCDEKMSLPSQIVRMLKESSDDEFKVILAAFEEKAP